MRAQERVGEPLPSPFRKLNDLRAFARRGQMGLTAAASGGGKTAFWCHWVMNARYPDGRPIPTLYFSSDSDTETVGVRIAQGVFGCSQDEAKKRLKTPGGWAELHAATEHIWWDFQVGPSLEHMDQEIEAYAIANGAYPHLVIADNLMDIDAGYGSDEGSNQREALLWGASRARETVAHFNFLHHVTGDNVEGNAPLGKRSLMNKVDKRPRLILTMFQDPGTPGFLNVSVVKNSLGQANSSGALYVPVAWVPERSLMIG